MLRKVISGRLYNSITWHNRLLFDYSKGESESKGVYWIYKINLTAADIIANIQQKIENWQQILLINNDDVTLHKGSLSSPLTQTEVPIDIQTPEGG